MSPKKRAFLAVAGVGLLAAVAAGGWRVAAGPRVDAYAVRRGDVLQTVVASGRVESPRRVDIAAQVTGTVVAVPVAEGQRVAAGRKLVVLDDAEARAAVDQARSAVAQAEARLAQLASTALPVAIEAVRQAEVTLGNAERQLARSRDLFARGFVGQAALDESQRARDLAESQWRSAQLQRAGNAPGGAEARVAEAALTQARANLRAAGARLDLLTLEAPVAGTLISRSVERGNVVQPGKTLMVLAPDGDTQIVVQIDEKNLHLLRVGQNALASADAYPTQRFAAQVAYINPGIDALRGSVEVKLRVPEPPPYLLQDMTASVDIEVARRAGVATLPAEAVHAGKSGPWVLAVNDGRATRRPVKLGLKGDGIVEVAEGVSADELVIAARPGAIAEGARVRAVAREGR